MNERHTDMPKGTKISLFEEDPLFSKKDTDFMNISQNIGVTSSVNDQEGSNVLKISQIIGNDAGTSKSAARRQSDACIYDPQQFRDNSLKRFTVAHKAPERVRVGAQSDPLSMQNISTANSGSSTPTPEGQVSRKAESLSIRVSDEARIVAAIRDAAKKHTTGSIFSVKVDIGKTGTLGIGVKDLFDNTLAVSMLKRADGVPGAGEMSGLRLGDIIFGINFVPTREGSKTLLNALKKDSTKAKRILHLQCWRCHQLCSDSIPGTLFPRADEMIVQSYSLYRTRVFSEWERWNFVEILLSYMVDDIKFRVIHANLNSPANFNTNENFIPKADSVGEDSGHSEKMQALQQKSLRARQMMVIDLEKNILQAKGLRTALCVRIVHTKVQSDTVVYVLRVEDVETGLQWVVHRRYRDFFSLHEELCDMSHFSKGIAFPKKTLSIRNNTRVVESRIVSLEQYIRRVLHILTLYATMDPQASRSLRHVQNFLGVDKYIDCIHPPPVDDQRFIELMAHRYLNDFNSPACQQCVRFLSSVDLDTFIGDGPSGYTEMLKQVSAALTEVEQFVLQQHQQQMALSLRNRRPDLSKEDIRVFVRKCVRRQVEAALFLPLRRSIFRIVYSFVSEKAQRMQRAMSILQQANADYLGVDDYVSRSPALPNAIKAFRDVIQAYLPADQGQLLMHAAAAVVELHGDIVAYQKRQQSSSAPSSTNGNVVTAVTTSTSEATIDRIDAFPSGQVAAGESEMLSSEDTPTEDFLESSRLSHREISETHVYSEAEDDSSAPADNPQSLLRNNNEAEAATPTVTASLAPFSHSLSIAPEDPATTSAASAPKLGSLGSTESSESIGEDENTAEVATTPSDLILDEHGAMQEVATASTGFFETSMVTQQSVVSADDFIPLFTYVLIQAGLPQLFLVKELMTSLVDDEETFGECGYYLATLEASTQHISSLADTFEKDFKPSIRPPNGLQSDFDALRI